MSDPKPLPGVKEANGWMELPMPLAEKIAKFVATTHLLLNHPDGGESFMGEMGIWLSDPEIKEWTKWMCHRMDRKTS